MNRKSIVFGLAIAVAILSSACGSTSKKKVLSIAVTAAPPASLEINQSASVAATVTNDSADGGVDWSCAPAGSCGAFSSAHTASGASTIYTAPAVSGPVTITAASSTSALVTANASVAIDAVATAASLSGTYTYFVNGVNSGGFPYSVAGSVALDGAGNVTAGEQDSVNVGAPAIAAITPIIVNADPLVPATGALVIGDDGRGTLTLTPTTAAPEVLSITVVNANHVLISEFDATATSAGSLDLQTAPASVPTGGNAFAVHSLSDAFVFGGVFTSDGTSTITAGVSDDDFTGSATFDNSITGSFTAPDASGRGTLTLAEPTFSENLTFAYYVVGPEVFRLVEIDSNFFAAGSVYGQGSAAFSSTSLGGAFAFSQSGDSAAGFGSYAAAGQFTGDGTDTVSAGVADINEGDGLPILAGDLTNSSYFVDSDGYAGFTLVGGTSGDLLEVGAYMVDPALNIADPNSSTGGGGALLIELDTDVLGIGMIVPQTAGATFAGNYALNLDGAYQTALVDTAPFDLVGQVFSDGTSTLTGLADFNDLFNTGLNPGIPVDATFAADAVNPGRLTSQITLNGAVAANAVSIYQASDSLLLLVDVDNSAASIGTVAQGTIQQQQ